MSGIEINNVLPYLASVILGFFTNMLVNWAKKGAATCDKHNDLILCTTQITTNYNNMLDTIRSLIQSNKDLTVKIDNLAGEISKHNLNIALLTERYEHIKKRLEV